MVVAGIVAGGTGKRMNNCTIPKQFLELEGKPIIIHTIEKFLASDAIDTIVVGVHQEWKDYTEELVYKYLGENTEVLITAGGENRNNTIEKIIEKAKTVWTIDDETIFVTHDAVRPFVSLKVIEKNVLAGKKYGVCDTVIVATDTIVESTNQKCITDVPIRKNMYQGQTPQSFKYGLFAQVYQSITKEEIKLATDVCKLFFLKGYKVYLVEGDVSNFKITYPYDFEMAKFMIGEKGND